jgi:hypothetical protein
MRASWTAQRTRLTRPSAPTTPTHAASLSSSAIDLFGHRLIVPLDEQLGRRKGVVTAGFRATVDSDAGVRERRCPTP